MGNSDFDKAGKTEAALLPLYRQRVDRLEATVRAYDAAMDTATVDRMRKRIAALEQALQAAVYAGGVTDARAALTMRGIAPHQVQQIIVLLSQKFAP